MPVIVTRFGSTIKYNELTSERRTKKFQENNPDPRKSIITFDSYQLYCEAEDLKKRYPRHFITNFRSSRTSFEVYRNIKIMFFVLSLVVFVIIVKSVKKNSSFINC